MGRAPLKSEVNKIKVGVGGKMSRTFSLIVLISLLKAAGKFIFRSSLANRYLHLSFALQPPFFATSVKVTMTGDARIPSKPDVST